MKGILRITTLMVSLVALTACTPFWESLGLGGGGDTVQTPPSAESRWASTLKTTGETVPMTVILAPEGGGLSRLLMLSDSGAAMGDCSLAPKGNSSCRTAPGAQPMVEKMAMAVTSMLDKNTKFVQSPSGGQGKLSDADWNASRDLKGNLNFQWTSSPRWSISFKRMR